MPNLHFEMLNGFSLHWSKSNFRWRFFLFLFLSNLINFNGISVHSWQERSSFFFSMISIYYDGSKSNRLLKTEHWHCAQCASWVLHVYSHKFLFIRFAISFYRPKTVAKTTTLQNSFIVSPLKEFIFSHRFFST